ncbi:hypothetical protein Ccrd_017227 [Cynara cardunculus var. scolymus]|uniref:Uncharacterized protein n=1 Tax=Cynara cardunculus var. scolymus TaxID=59895 RepID=A0A103Y8G5_CYNCS|nr:hypothetical protein Ccrd_017227 [Cynara cardunculus var. scolymus]
MSFLCSSPFSHKPSCSMVHNSTDNYENSKIWNGGEGTNGSVHIRFRLVGDGGVVVQANDANFDNNMSLFPSELLARPRTNTQVGDSWEEVLTVPSLLNLKRFFKKLYWSLFR